MEGLNGSTGCDRFHLNENLEPSLFVDVSGNTIVCAIPSIGSALAALALHGAHLKLAWRDGRTAVADIVELVPDRDPIFNAIREHQRAVREHMRNMRYYHERHAFQGANDEINVATQCLAEADHKLTSTQPTTLCWLESASRLCEEPQCRDEC
jgi:hypothetical protein